MIVSSPCKGLNPLARWDPWKDSRSETIWIAWASRYVSSKIRSLQRAWLEDGLLEKSGAWYGRIGSMLSHFQGLMCRSWQKFSPFTDDRMCRRVVPETCRKSFFKICGSFQSSCQLELWIRWNRLQIFLSILWYLEITFWGQCTTKPTPNQRVTLNHSAIDHRRQLLNIAHALKRATKESEVGLMPKQWCMWWWWPSTCPCFNLFRPAGCGLDVPSWPWRALFAAFRRVTGPRMLGCGCWVVLSDHIDKLTFNTSTIDHFCKTIWDTTWNQWHQKLVNQRLYRSTQILCF